VPPVTAPICAQRSIAAVDALRLVAPGVILRVAAVFTIGWLFWFVGRRELSTAHLVQPLPGVVVGCAAGLLVDLFVMGSAHVSLRSVNLRKSSGSLSVTNRRITHVVAEATAVV